MKASLVSDFSRRSAVCGLLMAASPFLDTALAERELASDRPDATESPFTVEPGRVQIEASVADYTRDRHNPEREDVRVTALSIAPVNIRIGLTPRAEVQLMADGYRDVETDDRTTGVSERVRGVGDVTVRAKWNFWGNDGGGTALGVMPFVKLPAARDGLGNNSIEGGVILPFAADLGGGWGFGAMTEVDVVRNTEEDDGYTPAWVNTATVSRELTEKLGMFVELAAEAGEGKPVLTANTGLTYAVNKDLQLDAGANLGVTRNADDLTLFTGFVNRF